MRFKINQAIILESLSNEEISNEQYIDALLEVVEAEEILRISINRLCVYLTTATKAAELVDVRKFVVVDRKKVNISHFMARFIKIETSNADASISNTAIKRFLNPVCK